MASLIPTELPYKAQSTANYCAKTVTLALSLVYIKAQYGYAITMPAGTAAILVVLARAQAKPGLIFLHMSWAVKAQRGDMWSPFLGGLQNVVMDMLGQARFIRSVQACQ